MRVNMRNGASYFCNRDCEYYPCHEIGGGEDFNCLFCFCPLYSMTDCGGRYSYTVQGIKDCSACLLPHRPEGYAYIVKKIGECHENLSE